MDAKKKYLEVVAADEKVGITEYGKVTIPGVPGAGMADAQDKAGKYGLEHTDGTPCDAKTPENCPHNKKAQRADDLSGAEGAKKADGGVSSKARKADDKFWGEVNAEIRKAFPYLSEDKADLEADSAISELDRDICGDGSNWNVDERGTFGEYSLNYSVPTELSPYTRTEKNADGEWVVSRKVSPVWSSKDIDDGVEEHNKSLRQRLGVELRRDKEASEKEMDDDLEFGPDGELVAKCQADMSLYVTDEQKFKSALMDEVKRREWLFRPDED